MTNLNSVFFEAGSPSPDCSVKPFAGLLHFFLLKKSDLIVPIAIGIFALEKSNKTKKLVADDGK